MKETLQFNFPNLAIEWQGVNLVEIAWQGDVSGGWTGPTGWGGAWVAGMGTAYYQSKKMDIRALTIQNEKVITPFFADVDYMMMPLTNTGTAGHLQQINEWHIISRVPLYEASLEALCYDYAQAEGGTPMGFNDSPETINDVIFQDYRRWIPTDYSGGGTTTNVYRDLFHRQCGSFDEIASTFIYYYRVINFEWDAVPIDQKIVMPPTVMKLSLQTERESTIPYLAARTLSSKVDPTMDVV